MADKVLFVVFCWVWVGFGGLWQIRRGVVSYVETRCVALWQIRRGEVSNGAFGYGMVGQIWH